MKIRVIPTVLTDGVSQVKGSNFDNWRTVGVISTAVQVHGSRDVDELVLLDVMASKQGRLMDLGLVTDASRALRVPLTVGGGIRSTADVVALLEAGADKVVIGTQAIENPELISSLADEFGSQAIVCAIDATGNALSSVSSFAGAIVHEKSPVEVAVELEAMGCGELLVQSVARDGLLNGMDINLFSKVAGAVTIPIIGSSGAGSPGDCVDAIRSGCSAVACGALFQFTETTPRDIKEALESEGFLTRV